MIGEENFKDIDPSLLRDPQRYSQMEAMLVSIDAAYTPDYSKEYAVLLHKKLEPVIDSMSAELAEKYLRALKVLRLQSLLTVKDETKAKFFREGILDCFRAPYTNVRSWVELLFVSNSGVRDIIESTRKLAVSGLRENIENLGGQPVNVPGENALKPPILKNWFSDYEAFVRNLPTRPVRAGRIEEGQYLNTAANAQKLGVDDRGILLKILELYDWLRFSKMEYDFSLPGVRPVAEPPAEEKEHILIPQNLADVINEYRRTGGQAKARPPEVAAPIPAQVPSRPSMMSDLRTPPPRRPAPTPRFTQERIINSPAPSRPVPQTPAPPRILSQTPVSEPRAKMDLLKPEVTKRQLESSRPERVPLSMRGEPSSLPPLTPEQQTATLVSGSKLFGMSLSHALANADQGLTTSGNIRTGTEVPPAPHRKEVPPAPTPVAPVLRSPSPPAPAAPKPPMDLGKLPQNPPAAPPIRPEPAVPAGVIDLSRRPVLDIASVTTPEQLTKIGLPEADGVYFSEKLSQIKQKIRDLSAEYQLPVSKVAENFYRSPLFQLFMNMGVAVMNDNTSPDQKTAFEKVVGNYKAARKDALSREQFLALSRLKKEISELEVKI